MIPTVTSPHSPAGKFSSLLDISRRINSEKNFDKLIEIIATEATQLIHAERATVFMFDKARSELWTRTGTGVSDTMRYDARYGIAGAVLIAGKTLTVEDAQKSPLFYPSMDAGPGLHTRNVLSVPLRTFKSDIIGVLQVVNKRTGPFMPEDEPFGEALAAQAAIALENAQALWELEVQKQALIEENQNLRKEVEKRFTFKNILGTASKISDIRTLIEKTADTSIPVLITGENGTGKELCARSIHFTSSRRDKSFVAVNCAALPEPLVESELFGIEKGVATGVEKRVGRIESANGGTLFLDEIADLSIAAQAKLLRVLQEREVEWVGGRKPVPVDIRLVAATNKDLKREINEGRFRQDLYFRLNVLHLHLPPLREIRVDIPLLAMHFLRKHSKEVGRDIRTFSKEATEALMGYSWPGNVRELENEVRRAMVMSVGNQIEWQDLSEAVREERMADPPSADIKGGGKQSLKTRVESLEIQMIRDAMAQTKNDKVRAAKILGLSLQGLLNKLKRYAIK
jgi:transcriptional regulator with GAF, ATPase, and Fis domain